MQPDSDTSSPPPPLSETERIQELETQNTALRKEIRCKDVEYDKIKAVLTQQVTLLKQQIADSTEREQSLRRMNETIFDTFTPDNKNCSKEMELQIQMHEREVQELNESHRSTVDGYEKQITEMRKNVLDIEHNLKKTSEEKQSALTEFKKQMNEVLLEKKGLEQKLKTFENDKKKDMEQLETGYQNKLEAQINLIERLKLEHAKEAEKLKIESENALKDIKYIYDQEKMVLDGRMEKQNNTIKILQMRKDSANTNNLSDLKTQYVEEIHDLNLQLETFKQHSMEELQATRQQKDNALQRVAELQAEVKRMGDEIVKERRCKQERGWNEMSRTMDERNNESRLEVQNLKAEVKRLRSEERKIKRETQHREERRTQELKEVQEELHFEKKKALEAKLEQNETRSEFDKRKEVILEEIVNKDEELKAVKKQHRVLEKEVERLQQIIQKHQISVCSMPLQQPSRREGSVSKMNNEVPPLDTSQALIYNQSMQPAAQPPSNRSLNRCLSQQSFYGKCQSCGESKLGKIRGNSSSGNRNSPPRCSTSMGRHHDSELSPMQIDHDSVAWKKVKAQHLKLLKTCQMMVDAASAMECSVCSSLYQTQQFLEHISSSSCFLADCQSMLNPSLQNTQINPALHRAQSQGILRVSQNVPFETTATTNPLLFTPMQNQETHDLQNYHQVNISSLGDDLSAITGPQHLYHGHDRPLSPRDMLQSPHPTSYPIRGSHTYTHFPQQSVPQFFPSQRSQPLSARSQASIVSQQQVITADMTHMIEHNRRLEEKLRDIELQLKEKENFLGDIKNQRDRQQLEYDKLNYELTSMRKENLQNREKTTESQQKLKHQISFLLERLLKTKNILAQTQEEKENLALSLQKQQQQIVASSPGSSVHQSHSHQQSPSHVLLATPNIYNDEVSFSSQLSGGSHYQPPSANTRYQTKASKHKSSSYLKKQEIGNDSADDHKVAEYSYYEQYSLLPVQRNNESHYNPINSSMYQQHYSMHSTKARASSPNSIAKSLSTFVQNSPLKHRFNEKVGGDSRILPPSYNVSHRQTPSSPKGSRKQNNVSRKAQRSFQQEGSPKRSKMYRSGSHRKGMTNIVQNMPHFTKKTIKDLNTPEDY